MTIDHAHLPPDQASDHQGGWTRIAGQLSRRLETPAAAPGVLTLAGTVGAQPPTRTCAGETLPWTRTGARSQVTPQNWVTGEVDQDAGGWPVPWLVAPDA
ncbi:MAG TPA: hypothetical protein VLW50_03190 [Streptosporangiaceae bacterium]|nr:hypothetical protein [Streptosporangiaceae bacterium]